MSVAYCMQCIVLAAENLNKSRPVQCTANLYTVLLTRTVAVVGWLSLTITSSVHMLIVAHCKCKIEVVSIIWPWLNLWNWMTLSKIEAVQWIRIRGGHLRNDVRDIHIKKKKYIYIYIYIYIYKQESLLSRNPMPPHVPWSCCHGNHMIYVQTALSWGGCTPQTPLVGSLTYAF